MTTDNLRTLFALVDKESRLLRLPVVALITILAGCYTIAGAFNAYLNHPLFSASILATDLTAVMAAVLGGMAIAGERSNRTADFLATLPITRWQIVLSKWVAGLLLLFPCTILHSVVGVWISFFPSIAHSDESVVMLGSSSFAWFGCVISLYGFAWLLSSFTTSETISACASIALAFAILVMCPLIVDMHSRDSAWDPVQVFGPCTLSVGILGLTIGTAYYLRRIAP